MPSWVTPDFLTAIGFAGALITFGAYVLAGWDATWLWVASLGFVVNWFGDSLDGSLARYRQIERPRYGYFLDNAIDLVTQLLLAAGIALSGYHLWGVMLPRAVRFLDDVRSELIARERLRSFPAQLRRRRSDGNARDVHYPEYRDVFLPAAANNLARLQMTYPNWLSLTWSSVDLGDLRPEHAFRSTPPGC